MPSLAKAIATAVIIGNRYDFVRPRKAGGRYAEEEEEKGEAGTTHTGLP